jgi:hypothetical protein
VDPDAPEKPEFDWSDAEARAAHLKEIVADAKAAALSLAEHAGTSPAANKAAALLSKIVSDGTEEGPPPRGPKRTPTRTSIGRLTPERYKLGMTAADSKTNPSTSL